MAPKNCQVCEQSQSKYKCPICLIPYCSLACFKKHKELPCSNHQIPTQPTIHSEPAVNVEKPCYVDDPGEVLQESQLQCIASSNDIRDSLKDKKLQKFIQSIDSSVNAENELDRAMENEEFRLFTEKILSSIGS